MMGMRSNRRLSRTGVASTLAEFELSLRLLSCAGERESGISMRTSDFLRRDPRAFTGVLCGETA